MAHSLNLLVVEDSIADFLLLRRYLSQNGLASKCWQVDHLEALDEALTTERWDLILSDFSVPRLAFRDTLKRVQKTHPDLPIILLSGSVGEEQAVELLKLGVSDFVLKDSMTRLVPAINRAMREVADQRARLEAEEAIRKTLAALERSNIELEQLTFAASHDLQEPVRGIVSFAQLVERRLNGAIDPELKRDLGFLVNSAYRMRDIVAGLSTFSELTRDYEQWAPQDCCQVVEQTAKRLEGEVRRTGAAIIHGPLPVVTGNGRQLAELFHILLSNSLKFARSGVPPRIAVTASADQGNWRFDVADNGIGIDSEYYEQMFWPFKRLEGHVDYPSPGLGLAIARRVVEHHGGTIWAESVVGTGTTMHFTLPVSPKHVGDLQH